MCCCSVAQLCLTLCDPMNWGSRLPVHHQLLELAQTHVHQVSDAIQPAHPLLSPSPPALNLSQHQGLFQRVSSLHQVSFSISPSNEYSELISFRIDWFDRLAVQRTLKSLLQRHSSKASILQCSFFFIVQLSHPCMTTGKTRALTIWTFVGKGPKVLFKCTVSKGTFRNKNSLVVQWSGLHAFTTTGLGLIPGQGAKNPQTRWCRRKKNGAYGFKTMQFYR